MDDDDDDGRSSTGRGVLERKMVGNESRVRLFGPEARQLRDERREDECVAGRGVFQLSTVTIKEKENKNKTNFYRLDVG